MAVFPLKIATPEGPVFDGQAEKLLVRGLTGEMAVLARHINCVCPLVDSIALVVADGQRRSARCGGGLLTVRDGQAFVASRSFSWQQF